MGTEKKMQPSLFHVPVSKDVVYTPEDLALDIIRYFNPSGLVLDPCMGDGAFYNQLPAGVERDWCEITKGRDFFSYARKVDWIVGNPPYSILLAWIRYSFRVSRSIVYLIPTHRLFASTEFLDDMQAWGGCVHIRRYGTGTSWGFPFGHDLSAVHYKYGYDGSTSWSRYKHEKDK